MLTVFELSKPRVLGLTPPFPEASFWELSRMGESVTELEMKLFNFGDASDELYPLITFPVLFLEKYLFFFSFPNPNEIDPLKPSLTRADLDIPPRRALGTDHPIMQLSVCKSISLLLVSHI